MRHLIGMDGLDDAGPGLLEILGRELGWDGAELWRMARRRAPAPRRRLDRARASSLDRFIGAGDGLGYEVGDGLPGMAWMSRAPLWKADITADPDLVRLEEGIADGVRSTVALPLRADGGPVGVIVLVSRTPREPEAGVERLLEAIGGQVTQFLQRRAAEARAAEQAADLQDAVRRRPRARRARTTCSPRATRCAARCATSRTPRPSSCSSRPAATRWRCPPRWAPPSTGWTSSSTRARSPPRRSSAAS